MPRMSDFRCIDLVCVGGRVGRFSGGGYCCILSIIVVGSIAPEAWNTRCIICSEHEVLILFWSCRCMKDSFFGKPMKPVVVPGHCTCRYASQKHGARYYEAVVTWSTRSLVNWWSQSLYPVVVLVVMHPRSMELGIMKLSLHEVLVLW